MATIWDSVVASATKAATQAGEATQVVATKAKLHADILLIDKDIHARKEKFGVEMYAHLESITSTQEFYVADDRLINIIRPTLIKAQREVAAYERKRDAMKGKVNMAEASRSGSASIFGASTIGEKFMNAAKYAAAGAKEAASKTELAMLERQILGFKEEFGVELYPIFESMEDNEGWLPTDRKVRSLYDSAREDIAQMLKTQEEKREQIKALEGLEGSGLTPPTVPPASTATPTVVATPVGQPSWSSTAPTTTTTMQPHPPAAAAAAANGYGSTFSATEQDKQHQTQQQQQSDGGFGFMQTPQPNNTVQSTTSDSCGFGFMQQTQSNNTTAAMPQYSNNPAEQQHPPSQNLGAVFDPFDGLASSSSSSFNNATQPAPANNSSNAFDPFSSSNNSQNGGSKSLSNADMNLFKY